MVDGGPARRLQVFRPEAGEVGKSAFAPRTCTPGRGSEQGGESAPDALSRWLAASRRLADETAPRHVPAELRDQYAATTSLRDFWEQCQAGRLEPIGRRKRSAATVSKERQTLNRWERFTRPADWRDDEPWPGPAIGDVTPGLLNQVFQRAAEAGLSAATISSFRSHLRTIFNHAASVGAIEQAPRFPVVDSHRQAVRIWSDEEIEAIYEALAEHKLLQSAFVLACNAGLRPVDLFLLRWDDLTEPAGNRPAVLEWTSRKTRKRQAVPLARVTWAHLERIRPMSELAAEPGWLFPGLSSPRCADPEKSREARARNRFMRDLLRRLKIRNAAKPWQICRATCNERYESVHEGVGQFILGHSLTGVNARSYREPSALIRRIVLELPQPPCFLRGAELTK